MQLTIVAIGKSMPRWVEAGFQEYSKRLPPEFHLQLIEIEAGKRGKNADITRILKDEGEKIIAAIPKSNPVIALEREGKEWDTPTLAKNLQQWQLESRSVSFLIGGPEGLSEDCLNKADQKWSLSRLTFPHPLVRIILAEQLYRAWSLLKGHPYHR